MSDEHFASETPVSEPVAEEQVWSLATSLLLHAGILLVIFLLMYLSPAPKLLGLSPPSIPVSFVAAENEPDSKADGDFKAPLGQAITTPSAPSSPSQAVAPRVPTPPPVAPAPDQQMEISGGEEASDMGEDDIMPTVQADSGAGLFAMAPRMQVIAPQHSQAAPAETLQAPSGGNQAGDSTAPPVGAPQDNGNGLGAGALSGNNAGPGGDDPDAKARAQYLRIRLNGAIQSQYIPLLKMFLRQLVFCGVHPIPVKNPKLFAEALVDFNLNGTLRNATLVPNAAFSSDPDYSVAAQRLMGALRSPACNHIALPPAFYSEWSHADILFFQSPDKLYGP